MRLSISMRKVRPSTAGCAPVLAEHGPEIKLPDLLRTIAQCPKWGSMDDGCRAQYAASSRTD